MHFVEDYQVVWFRCQVKQEINQRYFGCKDRIGDGEEIKKAGRLSVRGMYCTDFAYISHSRSPLLQRLRASV
jgi:hypothetical protein